MKANGGRGMERDYYRLADAAQQLGIPEDDLLHLGATGRARISAPVLNEGDFYVEPEEADPVYWFYASDMLLVPSQFLATIEAVGRSQVFRYIYSPEGEDDIAVSYYQWGLEDHAAMIYTEQRHLFVLAEELERLKQGRDLDSQQQMAIAARSKGMQDIGDTARASLQKQVAALALVLAEEKKKYKIGEAPNGNQIAEAVGNIIDALPVAKSRGVSSSAIRASIATGLQLLNG